MAKLTLDDLASLSNQVSAIATINENNAAIETAMENTLSRDGTIPNTMEANIDMNSNRIFNLPEPVDNTEPLRVIDAVDLAGLTVTPESAASILAKLITVDGSGSGVDADLLDGVEGTGYVKYADHGTLVVTNLDAGASGTAGTVDIFPTTASKGKLQISAADSAGDTTTNIVNASQAAARTYTIPDAGTDANFVMTQGSQTITGAKTFASAMTLSSTLAVTGAITPSGGVASALSTLSPRCCHTGNQPAITTTTPGTDTTPSTTESYLCELHLIGNATVTGIALFNGSAVAGNVTVYLTNIAGTNLASSASTAQSGTAAYQLIPFSSPLSAKGPATYYVVVQFNNTGARFRSHAIGSFGAGKLTSTTYGVFPTITAPTTFTASLGPIASLY